MKVSDYIWKHLSEIGVTHCFYVSGGAIMHLVDALHKSDITPIHMLHEQSAAIASDGYAQFTGKLGVCLVTSGPGALNALTACAASYIDSTPVLFISGQCKTADIKTFERSKGVGEVDILNMVKRITKDSISLRKGDLERIDDFLKLRLIQKALTGRKGPVWLEIPLDVQAVEIER